MGEMLGRFQRAVIRRPRSGLLLLLLAHAPMVLAYYLASWKYPMFGAMIPATALAWYLGVRRCGGRVESWSVSCFLLMAADLSLVAVGLWTGSVWLVSAGAVCCAVACLVSRGALTEPRWLMSMVLLLGLLLRLPQGLDERFQRGVDARLTGVSSVILHTAGVLHYIESGEIHLVRTVLRPEAARGGLASVWCLPVLACFFSAWFGRSAVHQLLALPLSAVLGVITSVGNTVLAAGISDWFGLDVSAGPAGFVYRLNWLIPGVMLAWSGDRLLKFLLDGIPEMQKTVAGKLQRVRENEDGELVVAARNPVIALWNSVVAPWPSSVAAGLVSAPLYYGHATAHRAAKSGSRRIREGLLHESDRAAMKAEGDSRGLTWSAPAAVFAMLLLVAQLARLLSMGVST
ncbi:MAG: hypothetical protein RL215_2926 [Planctomycetota bacterium]|jgi:hypothetical protein